MHVAWTSSRQEQLVSVYNVIFIAPTGKTGYTL